MKWIYIIKSKMLASAALLSLCLLVLTSNYIDRRHTENVKNSISSLYEDRLLAEEYILNMMSSLYQMKELIITDSSSNIQEIEIRNLFLSISATSDAYNKTKFTELEQLKAEQLAINLNSIDLVKMNTEKDQLTAINKSLVLLNELSLIQLAESKKIMGTAEKLYHFSEVSSQFVFAIIIVILLVLQGIVFASKTLITKATDQSANFN